MRFPKRRNEWLLGRLTTKDLLKNCSAEYAAIRSQDIQVTNEESGRPSLELLNHISPKIQLSISHRDSIAFCAISFDAHLNIGVDLELVEERFQSFVDDFFTPSEIDFVKNTNGTLHQEIVTIIWSAKEAILKASGSGLRVDTRQVEICRIEGTAENEATAQEWHAIKAVYPSSRKDPWNLWWKPFEEYVLTLAVDNEDRTNPAEDEIVLQEIRTTG